MKILRRLLFLSILFGTYQECYSAQQFQIGHQIDHQRRLFQVMTSLNSQRQQLYSINTPLDSRTQSLPGHRIDPFMDQSWRSNTNYRYLRPIGQQREYPSRQNQNQSQSFDIPSETLGGMENVPDFIRQQHEVVEAKPVMTQQQLRLEEKQNVLAAIDFENFENVDLSDLDLKTICTFSEQTDNPSTMQYVDKYGVKMSLTIDKFYAYCNFRFYKLASYRAMLESSSDFKEYMLGFDERLKTDISFRNELLKNDKLALKFIQDKAQQIRVSEELKLNAELKIEQPLYNNAQDLKFQIQEEQKYSTNDGIIIQRKAACAEFIKDSNAVTRTYNISPADKAYMVEKLNLDPKKFETFTGNILQQQNNYEVLTQISRAAKLGLNSDEFCKNLSTTVTKFSLVSMGHAQEKQYAKAYLFADAADSLLTFGENMVNNFKAQGEGVCKRLLEELASAKQLYDKPQETLTNLKKDYYNAVISVSKAIGSFALENINEILNPVITERKIELAINLTKKIGEMYNHVAEKLSDMSPQEFNRAWGYFLTDTAITYAKTKCATKVVTMTAPMIKESVARGKQALDNLGVMGTEIAEVVGESIKNGITSTRTVLDIAKQEFQLVATEGGVANFVKEAFEKNKKFIKSFNDIKLNPKLSNVEKVAAQASLLSKLRVKTAAETVAKHFGTVVEEANTLKGWKINVIRGKKTFVVRMMEAGSGQRTEPYFRIGISGRGSLTLEGKLSELDKLTHIDLTSDYLNQINTMIDSYK